jgi:hypothetical protein
MSRVPRARVLLVPQAPGPRTPQTPAVRRYRLGRISEFDVMMGPELLARPLSAAEDRRADPGRSQPSEAEETGGGP